MPEKSVTDSPDEMKSLNNFDLLKTVGTGKKMTKQDNFKSILFTIKRWKYSKHLFIKWIEFFSN